jgi:hypothetical protein
MWYVQGLEGPGKVSLKLRVTQNACQQTSFRGKTRVADRRYQPTHASVAVQLLPQQLQLTL